MINDLQHKISQVFPQGGYTMLGTDQVLVKETITNTQMEALMKIGRVTTTFTASGINLTFTAEEKKGASMLLSYKNEQIMAFLEGSPIEIGSALAKMCIMDHNLYRVMAEAVDFAKYKKSSACECPACRAMKEVERIINDKPAE
jgi:hypothetical protein